MQDSAPSGSFLFVGYGCCIPTESYAWIIVVLFIFTIAVLLFCIFATAIVRWLYKRRMRKRLQQVKEKLALDLQNLRENEARLSRVARGNKEEKEQSPVRNMSKEEDVIVQPISIYMDTSRHHLNRHTTPKRVVNASFVIPPRPAMAQSNVVFDNDTTQMAQSTLGSFTSIPPVREQQETIVELPAMKPPVFPNDKNKGSSSPAQEPAKTPSIKKIERNSSKNVKFDKNNANPVADAKRLSPGKDDVKDNELASTPKLKKVKSRPSQTSMNNALRPPSTVNTDKSSPDTFSPLAGRVNHTFSGVSSEKSSDSDPANHAAPVKKHSKPKAAINSPLRLKTSEPSVTREGAAGDKKGRPSGVGFGNSWLVDSTGTDCQLSTSAQDSLSVSKTNSLFQTDSSIYKTASIESYRHGAFVFERN